MFQISRFKFFKLCVFKYILIFIFLNSEVLQLNFDVYENMDQIYLNNKGRSLRNTAPNNDTIVNKQLLSKIIVISVKPIDILKQNKIPQIPTKLEYPVYFALSHLEVNNQNSCSFLEVLFFKLFIFHMITNHF